MTTAVAQTLFKKFKTKNSEHVKYFRNLNGDNINNNNNNNNIATTTFNQHNNNNINTMGIKYVIEHK